MNVKEVLENDPGAFFIHDELLAPLKVMYKSLQDTGDDSIANARLLDCMRQVSFPQPPQHPSPLFYPLQFAQNGSIAGCRASNVTSVCSHMQHTSTHPLPGQSEMRHLGTHLTAFPVAVSRHTVIVCLGRGPVEL